MVKQTDTFSIAVIYREHNKSPYRHDLIKNGRIAWSCYSQYPRIPKTLGNWVEQLNRLKMARKDDDQSGDD